MQIARDRGMVLNGVQASFPTAETLREWCMGEIFAYLSRRIPRKEDAEDLAVEVFVAAYESPRQPLSDEVKPWLFGIARRKLADYLRRRQRRPEALESEGREFAGMSDGQGPEKHYLQQEAIQMLRRIVDSLPPEQKEALLLQHLEDLSILDIAQVLEKSPAAVNSLLQRARGSIYTRGKTYFLEPQEVNS
jgi:RNA polymerase sigma factor (sigma-70 family)